MTRLVDPNAMVRILLLASASLLAPAPALAGAVPATGQLVFETAFSTQPVVFESSPPMGAMLSGSLVSGAGVSVAGATFVGTMPAGPFDAPP